MCSLSFTTNVARRTCVQLCLLQPVFRFSEPFDRRSFRGDKAQKCWKQNKTSYCFASSGNQECEPVFFSLTENYRKPVAPQTLRRLFCTCSWEVMLPICELIHVQALKLENGFGESKSRPSGWRTRLGVKEHFESPHLSTDSWYFLHGTECFYLVFIRVHTTSVHGCHAEQVGQFVLKSTWCKCITNLFSVVDFCKHETKNENRLLLWSR